jgi:hypothetical protein
VSSVSLRPTEQNPKEAYTQEEVAEWAAKTSRARAIHERVGTLKPEKVKEYLSANAVRERAQPSGPAPPG